MVYLIKKCYNFNTHSIPIYHSTSIMTNPLHHIQKRKRLYQKRKNLKKKYEPYPHPNKLKASVDDLVYAVGVLGPLFGSVQVYKIWVYKDAAGVSVLLFGSGIIFNMVWFVYGILHKEKPIILMYSLWLIINTLITIGAILYG